MPTAQSQQPQNSTQNRQSSSGVGYLGYLSAVGHYTNGGGQSVQYSAQSFMSTGFGSVISTANFPGVSGIISSLGVNQSVNVSERALYSYYANPQTSLSAPGVHGHAPFSLTGTITNLGNGRYSVSLEISPLDDNFDYHYNGVNALVEIGRYYAFLGTVALTGGKALFTGK